MKTLITAFFIMVIGITFSISGMIWYLYIYPRDYEYALKLADDASLPDAKAKYLKEYLENVKDISGPPRYIFMTPDLKLDTQRSIIEGLIERLVDISKLKPGEMAYQTGMAQVSRQEMDHQLDRISSIFRDAKVRENFLLYFVFNFLSWPFLILGLITAFIWLGRN